MDQYHEAIAHMAPAGRTKLMAMQGKMMQMEMEVAKMKRDIRLTGLQGVTWITVDGELLDVFIGPGESFLVPNDGKVVAFAMYGPALIALDGCAGAVRSLPATRGAHRLRGGLRRLFFGVR